MAPVGVDANGPQEAAHINTLRLSTTSCALSTPACLPTRLASPGYIFGHYGGVLQACPNMFETNCTSAAVMRFEDAPLMGIRVSSRRNSSSGTVPLGIGLRPAGCGLPARLGSARLGQEKRTTILVPCGPVSRRRRLLRVPQRFSVLDAPKYASGARWQHLVSLPDVWATWQFRPAPTHNAFGIKDGMEGSPGDPLVPRTLWSPRPALNLQAK